MNGNLSKKVLFIHMRIKGGGRGTGIVKFTIYQVHLGFRNINFSHISQVYYFKQLNINDKR